MNRSMYPHTYYMATKMQLILISEWKEGIENEK